MENPEQNQPLPTPDASPDRAQPPNPDPGSGGEAPGRAADSGEGAQAPNPAPEGKAAEAPESGSAEKPGEPARRRSVRDWLRNPPRPKAPAPDRQGFAFQVGVVLAVAFLVATLFTTWTPGLSSSELLLPPPATLIAQAFKPTPTGGKGVPTVTVLNPNRVGLVAGHWKNDSGAVCPDGLKEVDINLNVATRVQKLLQQQGYQVDVLKEFDDRLNGYQAAAVVSIHNDSCNFINNEATGFKAAAAMGTRHPERAALLTACLRARYGQATHLPVHSTSVTPDMTSYHAFGEIDENTPAAIIETGFMNLDREMLVQHPDVVAQGVANGILCFLRNEPLVTPKPPPSKPTVVAPSTP